MLLTCYTDDKHTHVNVWGSAGHTRWKQNRLGVFVLRSKTQQQAGSAFVD